MASCVEGSEGKTQPERPPPAKEQNPVQKTKDTKPTSDMAESGHDAVNPSSEHRGKSAPKDVQQHSSKEQHRSSGRARKRQYRGNASREPQDQEKHPDRTAGRQSGDRHRDVAGSKQRDSRCTEVFSHAKDKSNSVGDNDHIAESAKTAKDGEQEGGVKVREVQAIEQGDRGRGKRGRNRNRPRKRGDDDQERRRTGESSDERLQSNKADLFEGEQERSESSHQFYDRPHRGRGGGGWYGRGRRPRRSDRDWWRNEESQRPSGEKRDHRGRQSNRGGRSDRADQSDTGDRRDTGDRGDWTDWRGRIDQSDRGDRRVIEREERASERKRKQDDISGHEVNKKPEPKVSLDPDTVDIPSGVLTEPKSASELVPPVSEKITERLSTSSHSKPKSYDYTKPKPESDRDFLSKYKGRSHHRQKVAKKDFTPTIQSGELSQQLTAETYECMVCCESVRERDQIWSCQSCYHIFHLKCIKKWASAPSFASNDNDSNCDGWRCPSCRNLSKYVPTIYKCYCGKTTNPRRRSKGELTVPHSCGELCKKKLGTTPESTCRHHCQLPCHPGPCPPCPVMVSRSCPCGRTKHQVRCSKTGDVTSCESVCGKTLACGRHNCQDVCHSGPCPSCDVALELTCHCGRSKKTALCGEVDQMEFSCQQICNRELDCGNHLCERLCHSGACLSCSLLPANVTHCPCGAVTLATLLSEEEQRISCLDPVPTCHNVCGKRLPCSTPDTVHTCESVCHLGECPPCGKSILVECRCGRNSVERPCADLDKEGEYFCRHVCNKKKSCSRHRCNVRCCKDSDHMCELICGKKLQCGLHTCQENCHSGHCQPCWEYSYDELTCHCGAEVIYPPIPCGTRPPLCSNPCARLHPCSHTVTHTCHSDENCPKCTFLTEKMCMGGHEMRFNLPCHLTEVSCGSACGKTLPCGMHKCKRTCHRGECLSGSSEACQQPCTNQRKYCGHECGNPCHVGQPCPDTPCRTAIVVKCKCGRKSEKMLCLACGSGAMHQTFQKLFSKDLGARIRELQSGHSVSISDVTVSNEGSARYLDCDEVCAQEERNKKLAAALEIDSPNVSSTDSEAGQYSLFLLEQAREDLAFVSVVEDTFRNLAESALKGTSNQSRTHHFRPMRNIHRRVIHELAVYYGCDTTSFDQEPNRNVMVSVNKSKAKIPVFSLTKVIEKDKPRITPAPVSVNAVRCHVNTEDRAVTQAKSGNEIDTDKSSAPDYFYDDL